MIDHNGMLSGGAFFIGLAITFAVVYLVTRMGWAIWPAGALGAMGALLMLGAGGAAAFVWPVVLILAGGWLILKTVRGR